MLQQCSECGNRKDLTCMCPCGCGLLCGSCEMAGDGRCNKAHRELSSKLKERAAAFTILYAEEHIPAGRLV